MTLADLLGLTTFLFASTSIALAVLAWQERQRAARQEKRGDENYMWSEHYRLEADAAIARLHTLQRRYANLQTLYVDLVRRRLAESTSIIMRKEINHDQRN